MRVTKWSYDYNPKVDVPIAPVWVSLLGLPIYLHKQEALFEIAKMIGSALKEDSATMQLLRPSAARICIEIDVSQELP